jgi:hypothetical protein
MPPLSFLPVQVTGQPWSVIEVVLTGDTRVLVPSGESRDTPYSRAQRSYRHSGEESGLLAHEPRASSQRRGPHLEIQCHAMETSSRDDYQTRERQAYKEGWLAAVRHELDLSPNHNDAGLDCRWSDGYREGNRLSRAWKAERLKRLK